MHDIAQNALQQMPPTSRLRQEDREIILRNKDHLLALGPLIVKSFYDTLYDHPPTSAVFKEGERPAREGTLVNWWTRTINGPLDEDYFAWMALVGLVHVIRNVTNPMMLAMSDHVAELVSQKSHEFPIPPNEQQDLVAAFGRLAASVRAIITWGYDHAVSAALFEVAGMPEALLARLRDQEIVTALRDARSQLTV